MALLFLACRVLILLDRAYVGRFWTMLEAWLSLQKPSIDGLIPAPETEQRCTIVPLEEAAAAIAPAVPLAVLGDTLRAQWREFDPDKAYYRLSQPEVVVANPSDREVQLTKLLQLNELARRMMLNPSMLNPGLDKPTAASAVPPVAVTPTAYARPEAEEVDELKKLFAASGGSPS